MGAPPCSRPVPQMVRRVEDVADQDWTQAH
jgi:hypothetical protein